MTAMKSDCLIWVGQSYPTIQDFVDEARRLGCSRKVPFWPAWLGKGSRIFLAHHGGLKGPDEGVIFGYYELGGVDVIFEPADYDEYRRCRTEEQKMAFWARRRPHGGLPVHLNAPRSPNDDVAKFLADLRCCDDAGKPGFGCGFTTSETTLVEPRHCGENGLRYPAEDGRPTFYLVDKLAREISLEFCRELKNVVAKETREDTRWQQGAPAFHRAAERVRSRRVKTSLVLLPKPHRVFQHKEHAWFRGMAHIDGGRVIERRPRINTPYPGCVLV
jgi:hypothetical protein